MNRKQTENRMYTAFYDCSTVIHVLEHDFGIFRTYFLRTSCPGPKHCSCSCSSPAAGMFLCTGIEGRECRPSDSGIFKIKMQGASGHQFPCRGTWPAVQISSSNPWNSTPYERKKNSGHCPAEWAQFHVTSFITLIIRAHRTKPTRFSKKMLENFKDRKNQI